MGLLDLLRSVSYAAQVVPDGTRLYIALQQARAGNPDAQQFIRDHWREFAKSGLDMALRPGAGEIADHVFETGRQAIEQIRNSNYGAVDGEFRDVTNEPDRVRAPWTGFMNRVFSIGWGGHIVLGPNGSGKTELAKRLAQRIRETRGYRVEVIGMYGSDVPWFARPITPETLVKRVDMIRAYLDSQAIPDEADDLEIDDEDELPPTPVAKLPPGRRVIIIDEAGLNLETNAQNKVRQAALRSLAQCRHVNWVVLFLAQWAGQIPLPLMGSTTIWVKQPGGREAATDRDNRVVRDLWVRAEEGFAELRRTHYWQELPNAKAWSYVDCQSLAGGAGYTGMIPNLQVGEDDPDTDDGAIEGDYETIR